MDFRRSIVEIPQYVRFGVADCPFVLPFLHYRIPVLRA